MSSERDRALGAVYGLAIGDALGMPTQQLPAATIATAVGPLSWFHDGPAVNAISAGMPAGMVTDDTEQALIVAELLVEGRGTIDMHRFASRLREWERVASARGGEQLGPSTRRALDALAAGADIEQVGRRGDTNGAAMRIAPVGIAVGANPLARLVDVVAAASKLTHNTGLAISGAAAVATVISLGVAGEPPETATQLACAAAELGLERGAYSAGASVSRRIRFAVELARGCPTDEEFLADVADLIGSGVATQEAVPAAFALCARWPDDHWMVCRAAAGMGGDTDTIGAIAGAMVGARVGLEGLRADAVAHVRSVNDFEPDGLVEDLLRLRNR